VDRRCRIVGFSTTADTLAPGDTNRNREAFIRDRATGTTTRIQVPDGDTVDVHAGVPSISRDGRHVLVTASRSGTPSYLHYLYEVATGRLTEILRFDPPEGESLRPRLVDGGRLLAFQSSHPRLTPEDTNRTTDVFVQDRATGQLELISMDSSGTVGRDGSDLEDVTEDGRFVTFITRSRLHRQDRSRNDDLYLRDRRTGVTELVSVTSNERDKNALVSRGALSANGRWVAFSTVGRLHRSDRDRAEDVYLRDRTKGTTRLVSVQRPDSAPTSGKAGSPTISGNGRYVAFTAWNHHLVRGDTNAKPDMFVWDRRDRSMRRVTVSHTGAQGNGSSTGGFIAPGGSCVVFESGATNLVPGDSNGERDVFVRALRR
jgi:Tol biopolymer transport system component